MTKNKIDFNKMVGSNVRKIRKLKKLSQKSMAEVLGYSGPSSISKLEAGKYDITLSQVQKIAEYLAVSEEYLLGLSADPDSSARDVEYGITTLPIYELPDYVDSVDVGEKELNNYFTTDLSDLRSALAEEEEDIDFNSYIAVNSGLLSGATEDQIAGYLALSAYESSHNGVFDCLHCDPRDYLIFAKTRWFDPGDYLLITMPSKRYKKKYDLFFGIVEADYYRIGTSSTITIIDPASGVLLDIPCKWKEFKRALPKISTTLTTLHCCLANPQFNVIGKLELVIEDYKHRIQRQRTERETKIEMKKESEENKEYAGRVDLVDPTTQE